MRKRLQYMIIYMYVYSHILYMCSSIYMDQVCTCICIMYQDTSVHTVVNHAWKASDIHIFLRQSTMAGLSVSQFSFSWMSSQMAENHSLVLQLLGFDLGHSCFLTGKDLSLHKKREVKSLRLCMQLQLDKSVSVTAILYNINSVQCVSGFAIANITFNSISSFNQ